MTTASIAPASIDDVQNLLRQQSYIADRTLAVPIFLALKLERPLFLEGEAGVGKTEIAWALAHHLNNLDPKRSLGTQFTPRSRPRISCRTSTPGRHTGSRES